MQKKNKAPLKKRLSVNLDFKYDENRYKNTQFIAEKGSKADLAKSMKGKPSI